MKSYLTLLLTCFCITVMAQSESSFRRRNFNTENFVALREFDPVSYFQHKPVRGNPKLDYDYNGIIYYFSSEANLETFKKSPAKYEPAYGGYCAYTVATTGERVKIDPTAYKIVDGKLLLFYNFKGDNRLRKWNADRKKEKSLKAAADKNWTKKLH